MNYEEKIQELSNRIAVLEQAEQKRINKQKREIAFKIIKLVIILIIIISTYVYINNNLIKPYKEKIDYVNEKVNTVESFISEKWDGFFQQYNPFN